VEPTPKISNVIRCENQQPGPSVTTASVRVPKEKAIAKVFELIKIQKRIKNENEQQRHGPLEDMQK
jgi:hypothetical protein